jgi:hypothetical protein
VCRSALGREVIDSEGQPESQPYDREQEEDESENRDERRLSALALLLYLAEMLDFTFDFSDRCRKRLNAFR